MNARFSRLLQFYGISTDFIALNSVYLTTKYLMRENLQWDSIEYLHFWVCLNMAWLIISWLNSLVW